MGRMDCSFYFEAKELEIIFNYHHIHKREHLRMPNWAVQLTQPFINCFRLQGGYNEVIRTILLILFSFIYGLQFCYKLSTRQLIFLINPCHVISLLEIYLLAALPYASPNEYDFRTRKLTGVVYLIMP